jgi:hypothetical protein
MPEQGYLKQLKLSQELLLLSQLLLALLFQQGLKHLLVLLYLLELRKRPVRLVLPLSATLLQFPAGLPVPVLFLLTRLRQCYHQFLAESPEQSQRRSLEELGLHQGPL